jgi:8-oxo-dGTP pyrophosphatase MutT (NUDIX family)
MAFQPPRVDNPSIYAIIYAEQPETPAGPVEPSAPKRGKGNDKGKDSTRKVGVTKPGPHVLMAQKNTEMNWLNGQAANRRVSNNAGQHVFPGGGLHKDISQPDLNVNFQNDADVIKAIEREFLEETGMTLKIEAKEGGTIYLPLSEKNISISTWDIKKHGGSAPTSKAYAGFFIKLGSVKDLKAISKEFKNIRAKDLETYKNHPKKKRPPESEKGDFTPNPDYRIAGLMTLDDELKSFKDCPLSSAIQTFQNESRGQSTNSSVWFHGMAGSVKKIIADSMQPPVLPQAPLPVPEAALMPIAASNVQPEMHAPGYPEEEYSRTQPSAEYLSGWLPSPPPSVTLQPPPGFPPTWQPLPPSPITLQPPPGFPPGWPLLRPAPGYPPGTPPFPPPSITLQPPTPGQHRFNQPLPFQFQYPPAQQQWQQNLPTPAGQPGFNAQQSYFQHSQAHQPPLRPPPLSQQQRQETQPQQPQQHSPGQQQWQNSLPRPQQNLPTPAGRPGFNAQQSYFQHFQAHQPPLRPPPLPQQQRQEPQSQQSQQQVSKPTSSTLPQKPPG